jgi:hypothetical protein
LWMIQSCDVVGKVRGDASTLVQRAAGLMLLAVLVPNLLSCFTGAERDSLRAGEMPGRRRRISGPLPRENVSSMHPPAKAKPQRRIPLSGGTMWPSATPWLQGLARTGATGMSEDGLHPNDKGYRVIADRLGSLGYDPLYPR